MLLLCVISKSVIKQNTHSTIMAIETTSTDIDAQLENLEMMLDDQLKLGTKEQILELAEALGITTVDQESRKNIMLRTIRSHLYSEWGSTNQENYDYLVFITNAASKVIVKDLPDLQDENTMPSDKNQGKIKIDSPQDTQNNPNPETSKEKTEGNPSSNEWLKLMTSANDVNPFRRHLKIQGTIGDNKDKNSLNFINLASQVNDARSNGYNDAEIARAIKKAISPSSYIRTYFDTDESSSLSKMLQMIRHFFNEKSAPELYNDLSSLCQKPDEKSTDFLLRALEQRQRVSSASQLEGGLYNFKLVHETFSRALRTGLRDESVRAHMKSFLDPGLKMPTPDEKLLMEINKASLEVEELQAKQNTATVKKVHVKEASLNSTQDGAMAEVLKPLVEGMTLIQKQIKEMQESRNYGQNRKDYRCKKCREEKSTDRCTHCYKCMQSGHQAMECRQQGN